MAGTDDKVQIGTSADYLEGVSVDTTAGTGLFREGVVVSDPVTSDARARVLAVEPSDSEYAQTVRTTGRVKATITNESGAWDYRSGTAGTPSIPDGARILQISAAAPTLTGATFAINAGNTITVPAGQAVTFEPKGNLVAPTIVFTGTASYIVEFVT